MASNFAVLWPTKPKFSASKDLNTFSIVLKFQESSRILRMGFALSKWPHLLHKMGFVDSLAHTTVVVSKDSVSPVKFYITINNSEVHILCVFRYQTQCIPLRFFSNIWQILFYIDTHFSLQNLKVFHSKKKFKEFLSCQRFNDNSFYNSFYQISQNVLNNHFDLIYATPSWLKCSLQTIKIAICASSKPYKYLKICFQIPIRTP